MIRKDGEQRQLNKIMLFMTGVSGWVRVTRCYSWWYPVAEPDNRPPTQLFEFTVALDHTVLIALLCFLHTSYFVFVMKHNWQIQRSKWAKEDLAVYHFDSPGVTLISSGRGPIPACKCLNRREWRPFRRKLFSEYVWRIGFLVKGRWNKVSSEPMRKNLVKCKWKRTWCWWERTRGW